MTKRKAQLDSINVVTYSWWGGDNAPPAHLKTQKQLSEMALAPVAHVGLIPTAKYDLKLYDPGDERSVRKKKKASPAQLAALQKGRLRASFNRAFRGWIRDESFLEADRVSAVRWARDVLASPSKWLILDTETSGLSAQHDRIVEVAIIDLEGNALLNSLVRPTGDWSMDLGAAAVHGICEDDIAESPLFSEIYPQLKAIANGRRFITYGASFDSGMVNAAIKRAGLPLLEVEWHCLMESYAQWCGEWSDYHESYTWQPLGGNHRAFGDCQTALNRIQAMAAGDAEFHYPHWLVEMAQEVGEELTLK